MPYCPQCGEQSSVDANFCFNCGAALRTAHKVPDKKEWVSHKGLPIAKIGEQFRLERRKHLCVLWASHRDPEKLGPLVKNAKFICKTCGRVAEKQKNLCAPTPI